MRQLHPTVRELSPADLYDVYAEAGPHLRAGFVMSANGVIAVDGQSAPLGSPADHAVFTALRAVSDAVVVGAGTARKEDYGPVEHSDEATAWRAGHGLSEQTPVVVVSRTGKLPPRLREGPVLLAVPEGVEVAPGIETIRTTDPRALVAELHARGLARLLCEGGPSLLTGFLTAGVVDELCLTTAPALVADGPHLLGDLPAQELSLVSLLTDDPGVLLARWAVVRSGHA
jgi:riboflavin biosynthesis pyrimidine reductase